MKVLAINGSPREGGNTTIAIKRVFNVLEHEGIECELIELGCHEYRGCIACYRCFETKDKKCSIAKDGINKLIEKMLEADCIILGSPTYFADVTSNMKSVIDRCGMVGKANNNMFKRKIGAAVVSVRRGGAIHVFDTINHFFLAEEMIVAGSSYWNMNIGRNIGDIEDDEEGMTTMQRLGENIAWLLKKIK